MVEVPAATPATTPVVAPIAATPVLLLAHVPPAGELLSVVDDPMQTLRLPDTALGLALTETVRVTKHPVVGAV